MPMARKKAWERQIQNVAEIGFENVKLIPQVQNWCQHMNINSSMAGMVAEFYRVPTNHSITCDHAESGRIESMHLRHVATSFIIKNCRNCPHHAPISDDNIGRVILAEYEATQREKAREENKQKEAKARLHGLVSGDLSEAIHNEHVTIQSILKLISLLDDENIHLEAAQKLIQASKVAPELFSDLAIEVICSHFVDLKHGEQCIEVVRELCTQHDRVYPVAYEAAKRCLNDQHRADDACFIIGLAIAKEPSLINEALVKSIVHVSKYHGIGSYLESDYEAYDGRNFALGQIVHNTPALLKNILESALQSKNKNIRILATNVIEFLAFIVPSFSLDLTHPMIRSLELDDDTFDSGSADSAVCDVLAALYASYPDQMQAKFELEFPHLSREGQTILLSVYKQITWAAHWKESKNDSIYVECLPLIIPRMIQIVGGMVYSYDAKHSAVDGLENIASNFPDLLFSYLDSMLGMLVNLSYELVLISQSNETNDLLSSGEKLGNEQEQEYLVRTITKIIQLLAKSQPSTILTALDAIESTLHSNVQHEARCKAQLVDIYGTLAHQHELTPVIIPKLYRFLMDFDSVLIRGSAVRAIGDLLAKMPQAVPKTMIEMLVHYLNDTYVYVHKSAARAVRRIPLNTIEESFEIVFRLAHLFKIYSDAPYFRKEILESMLVIVRPFPNLIEAIAVPRLAEQAHADEYFLVTDALEEYHRVLHLLPDRYSAHFVKLVVNFFEKHKRHMSPADKTEDMFILLFNLPRHAILPNVDYIQHSAVAISKDSPWLGFQLAGLLLYYEQYSAVVKTASEIAAQQPKTKRYEWVARHAVLIEAIAQTEIEAMNGNFVVAQELANTASVLKKNDDDEREEETIDYTDIYAIEERIAQRTRLL